MRVAALVSQHPGTKRAKGVAALAFVPLPGAALLELAFGHIVDRAETGYVCHCVGFVHIFGGAADDDAQLDFPVRLVRAARYSIASKGPDTELMALRKESALEHGCGGVVGVVQAHADDLADAAHAVTRSVLRKAQCIWDLIERSRYPGAGRSAKP